MVNSEKKCFSLGNLSKYHIIPFFVPIFCMITTYVQRDEIIKNEKENYLDKFDENYELPYFINTFYSKLFSGFLCFLSKCILNKKEISSSSNPTRTKRKYHLVVNSINKLKIICYIIIISILEVIFKIENVRTLKSKGLIEIKLGFTIFVPFFTYIFLHSKYFKHHYISIGIGLFGLFFVSLSLLFPNNDSESHSFIEHFRHFIFSLPFSLSIVLIKYLFKHYFIDPFTFLFLDGIFCILFSFAYVFIKTFIIFNDSGLFINNLNNLLFAFRDSTIFSLFLCILISSFCYYLANYLTLYFFTPTLLIMTDLLSPIIRWIIDSLVNYFIYDQYLHPIQLILKAFGYFFLMAAAIIFNEIIICYICGMGYYTYPEIDMRAMEDCKDGNEIMSNNTSIMSYE
jgi:hypothetical protein